MKMFNVTVRAVVTKTYSVMAEDADKAQELAHSIFSVLNDDTDECYTQDVIDWEEVKGN